MANAAAKKQATANTQALKQLHLASLAINAVFILSHFLLHRPRSIKQYLLFSMPAAFIQWQLERIGRPVYDVKGVLVRSGDDLSQAGLTEWMHDVVYVTWVCDILVLATGSNKCWWLIMAIPGYAAWMIYTKFIRRSGPAAGPQEEEPKQSKRQEKLERRGGKKKYM